MPRKVVDLLAQPDSASALAKLAIMTELVICAALWIRPTRVVAMWWGVWFHIAIQLTTKVETFTLLTLAMYGVVRDARLSRAHAALRPVALLGKDGGQRSFRSSTGSGASR